MLLTDLPHTILSSILTYVKDDPMTLINAEMTCGTLYNILVLVANVALWSHCSGNWDEDHHMRQQTHRMRARFILALERVRMEQQTI